MKTRLLLPLLILTVVAACSPSRDKAVAQIKEQEAALLDDTLEADTLKAQRLMDAYANFASRFPDDSLSPHYLFRASDLAYSIANPQQSLHFLNQIISNYPEFPELSTCYFMRANAYEECEMNDSATAAYTEFLQLFPNDPFAEAAQFSLQNIGIPLNVVLERLIEQTATIE
ncbi:MAG: hypothetical protein IJV22_00415 [Bacteroidales bacterium]|nr:hypothetical protein [Bacteroidales bacterium]